MCIVTSHLLKPTFLIFLLHTYKFENGLSNKERYEEITEKLLTDQTTAIRKLSGLYRVYVEYRLVDVNSNEVVDQGISIKDCKPNAFFFPLGMFEKSSDSHFLAVIITIII